MKTKMTRGNFMVSSDFKECSELRELEWTEGLSKAKGQGGQSSLMQMKRARTKIVMVSGSQDKKDARTSSVGRPMMTVFCAVDLWIFQ